jgi:IPT/TIG domain
MRAPRVSCFFLLTILASVFANTPQLTGAQEAPPPSAARILLVPWRMVSGDRATLAVLDIGGRLTPNVSIQFSNGDQVKTDATGRALYVAPLTPGPLFASIAGRPGKVRTLVLSPQQAATYGIEVSSAPRMASLSDWFTINGGGFCGDADKNTVTVGGEKALVLASSQLSLLALPPASLSPGPARVSVSCGKQVVADFSMVFLSLELQADDSPLVPGQQRTMIVRVRGTKAKVPLAARNLAPEVAELAGGNPVRLSTSGGEENYARFELTGRSHGRILVSIRLRPTYARPRR